MKILELQDGDIHLNASNELGYILNLQTKLALDLRPVPPTAEGTGRGVCVQSQRIIYLPLPKLAIVYKYRPVEPRVGITKGFPQSSLCSLVSLVD